MAYPQTYVVEKFLNMARYRPDDWDVLVGVYFTTSVVSPLDVLWGSIGTKKWERDWRRIDMLDKDADCYPTWHLSEHVEKQGLVQAMFVHHRMVEYFVEAMKMVAKEDDLGHDSRLRSVLETAGLVYPYLRCS